MQAASEGADVAAAGAAAAGAGAVVGALPSEPANGSRTWPGSGGSQQHPDILSPQAGLGVTLASSCVPPGPPGGLTDAGTQPNAGQEPNTKAVLQRQRRQVIASSIVGNVLEWYDFLVFAYQSVVISKLFFPQQDTYTRYLSVYGIFAAGFVTRPLGAMFFGWLGDRYSRKTALLASIYTMSIPTFLMGCLPTYASAGRVAPWLLVLTRIVQGFAVGGEFTATIVFLVEHAPPSQAGLQGSWAFFSVMVGVLCGSGISMLFNYALSDQQLYSWGWRVPFLLSLAGAAVGVYMRRHVHEPPQIEHGNAHLSGQRRGLLSGPLINQDGGQYDRCLDGQECDHRDGQPSSLLPAEGKGCDHVSRQDNRRADKQYSDLTDRHYEGLLATHSADVQYSHHQDWQYGESLHAVGHLGERSADNNAKHTGNGNGCTDMNQLTNSEPSVGTLAKGRYAAGDGKGCGRGPLPSLELPLWRSGNVTSDAAGAQPPTLVHGFGAAGATTSSAADSRASARDATAEVFGGAADGRAARAGSMDAERDSLLHGPPSANGHGYGYSGDHHGGVKGTSNQVDALGPPWRTAGHGCRAGWARLQAKAYALVLRPVAKAIIGSFTVFFIDFLTAVGFYLVVIFVPTYLQEFTDLTRRQATSVHTVNMVLYMLLIPIGGYLSDRAGRVPLIVIPGALMAALAYPLWKLLSSRGSVLMALEGQAALCSIMALFNGALPATLCHLFHPRYRCTGVSVGHNVSMAVCGGTAPLIATALMKQAGSSMAPAFMLVVAGVLTAVGGVMARVLFGII